MKRKIDFIHYIVKNIYIFVLHTVLILSSRKYDLHIINVTVLKLPSPGIETPTLHDMWRYQSSQRVDSLARVVITPICHTVRHTLIFETITKNKGVQKASF